MILDARSKGGSLRGALIDLDTMKPLRWAFWANTATGEWAEYVVDAAGRKLYEAQFADLRTGRAEWVDVGPNPHPTAADAAVPVRGVLRVSTVRPKVVRRRGRVEWVPDAANSGKARPPVLLPRVNS